MSEEYKLSGEFKRWLFNARRKHLSRTLSSTAVAPIVLGVIALLPLLIFPIEFKRALGTFSESYPALSSLLILFVVLLCVIMCCWYFFKKLPPHEYAKITIDGNSNSDIFSIISYEIFKICRQFKNNRSIKNLQKIKEELEYQLTQWRDSDFHDVKSMKEYSETILERMDKPIWGIRALENKQQKVLQDIFEMKKLASEQLRIPARRLCDCIFQFSPAIYSQRFRKFINSWEELKDLLSIQPVETGHWERIFDLIHFIDRIEKGINSRILYQWQLMEYRKLHNVLHGIASDISTSSALKNYILGLSLTVKLKSSKTECFKMLTFLYYKRNVHTGFDLHRATKNYCERYSSTNKVPGDVTLVLNKIGTIRWDEIKNLLFDEYNFEPLKYLLISFDSDTVKSREEITIKFRESFKEWFKQCKSKIVVIHGLSKTVRQVLRKALFEVPENEREFTDGLIIFILKKEEERDEQLGTRLMRHELRERTESHDDWNRGINIIAGDKDFLFGLLQNNTKVLFLLGAECFDNNRVIHSNGISSILDGLRIRIGYANSKVFVVAEKYKEYDDLLEQPELYNDHLEHIDIYNANLIDEIICG